MPGEHGTQHTSKTHWQRDSARLDSENPAPGERPGQIHVQDKNYPGQKWQWNFNERQFDRIPNDVAEILRSDYQNFRNALNNALRHLGETLVQGGS